MGEIGKKKGVTGPEVVQNATGKILLDLSPGNRPLWFSALSTRPNGAGDHLRDPLVHWSCPWCFAGQVLDPQSSRSPCSHSLSQQLDTKAVCVGGLWNIDGDSHTPIAWARIGRDRIMWTPPKFSACASWKDGCLVCAARELTEAVLRAVEEHSIGVWTAELSMPSSAREVPQAPVAPTITIWCGLT